MEHFIVPPPPTFEPRAAIHMGYLLEGALTKFLNINNGGSRKGVNPFSVFFTPAVKATVKQRRSAPVVLTLTVCTPFFANS